MIPKGERDQFRASVQPGPGGLDLRALLDHADEADALIRDFHGFAAFVSQTCSGTTEGIMARNLIARVPEELRP